MAVFEQQEEELPQIPKSSRWFEIFYLDSKMILLTLDIPTEPVDIGRFCLLELEFNVS